MLTGFYFRGLCAVLVDALEVKIIDESASNFPDCLFAIYACGLRSYFFIVFMCGILLLCSSVPC